MVTANLMDRPLTAADLSDLPDDGMRYELIWGELHVSPAPEIRHQVAVANLMEILQAKITQVGNGMVLSAPLDIQLDENNVVQPDLIVVSVENRSAIQGAAFSGVPDLVVEVLSPTSRRRDFVLKSVLYARNGVPEYWVVDPESERIHVYTLEGTAYAEQPTSDGIVRSLMFPDVAVNPENVFSLPEAMRS